MHAPRTLWLAIPVLFLAACGPLEDDAESSADEEAMAQVLPDVEEPSPPDEVQAQAAPPLPSRQR